MFWRKKKKTDFMEHYQRCVDAFLEHDYRRSLTLASELMAASMLNFEILLLTLISMMRLVDMDKARGTYLKVVSRLGTDGHPDAAWHATLLQLLFGDATLAEALRAARDNHSRCQAHFCEGIRKLNLADKEGAEKELQTSVDVGGGCLEARLAASQKKLLERSVLARG